MLKMLQDCLLVSVAMLPLGKQSLPACCCCCYPRKLMSVPVAAQAKIELVSAYAGGSGVKFYKPQREMAARNLAKNMGDGKGGASKQGANESKGRAIRLPAWSTSR